MAWIHTVAPEAATGLLARVYREAVARAGKVYNVLRVMSPRPHSLAASVKLYTEVMHSARSPLARAQRELIATVVSRENGCVY
jgi:alkylhydroperoxidase family enzyme